MKKKRLTTVKADSSTGPSNRKVSRRALYIIIATLIVCAGLAGAYFLTTNKQHLQPGASTPCAGDIAKAAHSAISNGDSTGLLAQAETIRKNKQYESDLTCVYIVTEADLVLGDTAAAAEDNKKLQALAASGAVLDEPFTRTTVMVQSTNEAVAALQNRKIDVDSDSNDPNRAVPDEK
ncbi:MAG: hypothetical protein ABIR91_03490 [Candidatus Saccharimonadales bacterium]